MPLVGLLAWVFARKVMPVSRLVQQLKANVTEAADESVVGIEMVQAFGREDDVRSRFGDKARAVRDGVVRQARIEGSYLPGLLFLPTGSIAVVLFVGGRDVISGSLTLGEFFLFYSLLLQLVWPLEALGWIINLGQRAAASASRSFAWLELIDEIPGAEGREAPAGRAARRALRERPLLLRLRQGGAARCRPARRAERDRGALRPDRRGQDDAAQPAAALLRPHRGPRAHRRRRRARRSDRGAALGRGDRDAAADPLLDPAQGQPDRRSAGRAVGRGARRVRGRGRRRVRERPAERVRHADRRARRQPLRVGSASASRSRARSSRARASSSSTIRSPPSTPRPSGCSSTTLRPAVAGRTVLVATQRLSTVQVADRAVVLEDGRIVEDGAPPDLLERGGAFARLFGDEVLAAA